MRTLNWPIEHSRRRKGIPLARSVTAAFIGAYSGAASLAVLLFMSGSLECGSHHVPYQLLFSLGLGVWVTTRSSRRLGGFSPLALVLALPIFWFALMLIVMFTSVHRGCGLYGIGL
jgi:ABC-type antimicrobial peptide transport system permease subunit